MKIYAENKMKVNLNVVACRICITRDGNKRDGNILDDLAEGDLLYYHNHLQVLYSPYNIDSARFSNTCKMQLNNKLYFIAGIIFIANVLFYMNFPPVRTAMAK